MLKQTLISIKKQLAAIQNKKEEKVNALLQAKIQNLIKGAFEGGRSDGGDAGGARGRLAGLLSAAIEQSTGGQKQLEDLDGEPSVLEDRRVSGGAARSQLDQDSKLAGTVAGQLPDQEQTRLAKSLFQSILSSDGDRATTRNSQIAPKQPSLGAGARISAQNKLQIKKYRKVEARPEAPS